MYRCKPQNNKTALRRLFLLTKITVNFFVNYHEFYRKIDDD